MVNPEREFVHEFANTWLVVPFFNEGEVARGVIEEALGTFPNVVCVDDGSADGLGEDLRGLGVHLLSHRLNRGQGAALQTGIDYVLKQPNVDFVITFDADGQHPVEDAARMVRLAKARDLGFVLGSRFGGSNNQGTFRSRSRGDGQARVGRFRAAVLKLVAAVSSASTGLQLSDAHNGLRVLRRDAAEQLDLTQDRMAHASQIVSQLAGTGLPWEEVPVNIRYTDYSRAKGQSLLNSVNILLDLLVR